MADAVLALNAGSSSLKFAVYRNVSGKIVPISKGEVEEIGTAPHFVARDSAGVVLIEKRWQSETFARLLGELLAWVDRHLGDDRLVGIGHRVVHGGRDYTAPVLVSGAVLTALEALTPLAPLHQPHSLAPMRAIATLRPGLPQIACFDTAFHHTMPPVATRFALPREYEDAGVRHYGFHGLSYEYIAGRLRDVAPRLAAGRVIVAHLGNGASLCAMRAGVSIDTTMTFTALDGLVMGTRCGAIDPGVLLYLQQARGMEVAAIEDLLYHRSGLLGVSGISADMRTLIASDDPHAAAAIELFCWRIARETSALTAALGGLDGIVFTAGIGEHVATVRDMACAHLAWLGVAIDGDANARGETRISTTASHVTVLVIPTDEEAMIARHTRDVLQSL